jgi:hypothetical protein
MGFLLGVDGVTGWKWRFYGGIVGGRQGGVKGKECVNNEMID